MSETLEVLGVACLAAFAYCIWPPAAFAVAGVALLIAGVALDGVKLGGKR